MGLEIYYLIIILTFFRSVISNISLFFVLRWVKNPKKIQRISHDHDFIAVIPVLREQKAIEETVKHFLRINYPKSRITILIVTTEKELVSSKNNEQTTIDLVYDLSKKLNQAYSREIVQVIHYPKADGKMVDQLNFAFSYILKKYKGNKKEVFVSIYNADSRPSLETFGIVSNKAKSNEKMRVFQQSAIFYDNFHDVGRGDFFKTKLLQANGTLHSRWTLAHEVPRLFRQSYFLNKFNKRIFLTHCVGHGLFLRGDLMEEIKEMPTGTVTEDLFFGYVLSLLGESINPVPVLEVAEMPNNIIGAIKQKYVWFFGPLDHFNYEKYFSNKFPNKANSLLMKWFTFQGIFPAFIWLIQGWCFVYLFTYPFLSEQSYLLLVSLGVFLFYGPLSYWMILKNYNYLSRVSSKHDEITYIDVAGVLLNCFPAVLMHSIPPVFSIYSKIRFLLTGIEPSKPKTER